MIRFIAGILAVLLAQTIGLDTITATLRKADNAIRAGYDASAAQIAAERARK
jgi:hypothetical protein